jgi:hypothetical protein
MLWMQAKGRAMCVMGLTAVMHVFAAAQHARHYAMCCCGVQQCMCCLESRSLQQHTDRSSLPAQYSTVQYSTAQYNAAMEVCYLLQLGVLWLDADTTAFIRHCCPGGCSQSVSVWTGQGTNT